ncbi:MAG: hypothetical protein GY727_10910, partial [Gammaproteobacteria bacterium]|nr:hypothetical protein [Gammaproteobacteria bacterium]
FKRSHVKAGEKIRTSSNSLVQIRMIDKAFIALRSNSEVKIEAYKLGVDKNEDSGIFELLRGGFRAVTGIIGKRLRSAYKMKTVNATIGVRGTDFTARICNKDCNQAFGNLTSASGIADGLYVGVNEGGINLTNQLGTLDLDEMQFGYVKDATTAPIALLSAPEFLYFNSRPPNPDDDQSSDGEAEVTSEATKSTLATRAAKEPVRADLISDKTIQQDLGADSEDVSQDEIDANKEIPTVVETETGEPVDISKGEVPTTRMISISYGRQGASGSVSTIYSNPFSTTEMVNNELLKFENNHIDPDVGVGVYMQGTTTSIDLGFDPETGIAWGRWNSGTAQFQSASGATESMDFTNSSLHWVSSPNREQPIALPSTGSSTYTLIGNTSPTDNLGNTGILGAASLTADFTSMTVDTSVDIGINNRVWNGSGTGLPITSNGGFTGNLTVDVDSGTYTGTGNAAGFFTNNADGAGLGYSLEVDTGLPTTVTGTAIFKK